MVKTHKQKREPAPKPVPLLGFTIRPVPALGIATCPLLVLAASDSNLPSPDSLRPAEFRLYPWKVLGLTTCPIPVLEIVCFTTCPITSSSFKAYVLSCPEWGGAGASANVVSAVGRERTCPYGRFCPRSRGGEQRGGFCPRWVKEVG